MTASRSNNPSPGGDRSVSQNSIDVDASTSSSPRKEKITDSPKRKLDLLAIDLVIRTIVYVAFLYLSSSNLIDYALVLTAQHSVRYYVHLLYSEQSIFQANISAVRSKLSNRRKIVEQIMRHGRVLVGGLLCEILFVGFVLLLSKKSFL